uniref:Amidase domain-containing protein n=1 Tax=Bionectria ochroleuca TaxID=29856 RepID=A0A8H7TM40_BIOOC
MRLFSLVFLPFCAASITSTGSTILLNDVAYFISPHFVGSIALQAHALDNIECVFGFAPLSVLPPGTQPDDISTVFSSWKAIDDVFQPGFSQLILNETQSLSNSTTQKVEVTGQGTLTVASYMSESIVSEGPYFFDKTTGNLHQAYRLYDDFAGAFTEALLDKSDGTFQVMSAKVAGSATLSIGVPSRLYYKPSKERPLAGIRIAVKDIFSLAGVKRSNGNRAWYHLYPPSNVTAVAISRLVEAGAVIVGTQKLSQFATSEIATVDWVDYHSPFNPRGDGYQDPSSSSSGAGASVASYDWLDAAVCTDTGGSIRSPAGVSGVFGNRASHGLVSLDHVMPLSEPLDTAGFLARDPALWEKLQAVMYGSNYTSLASLQPRYPVNIMTVTYPDSSTEAGRLLNNFAAALAKFLGGNLSTLDVASAWTRDKTNPHANLNFTETFNITYPVLTGKGQDNLTNQFFADYARLHDGRRPFVNPSPLARWAWAANYSWDGALHNKTMFADWFNGEILPPVDDPFQCSSSLILYAGKTGTQAPRNRYDIAPPLPFTGFSAARMSVFSGCPDFIYPVGEVSKLSNLTNHDEKLPVAVGILAAKGCDGLLARLAMDLVGEGILKIPQVGGSMSGKTILF